MSTTTHTVTGAERHVITAMSTTPRTAMQIKRMMTAPAPVATIRTVADRLVTAGLVVSSADGYALADAGVAVILGRSPEVVEGPTTTPAPEDDAPANVEMYQARDLRPGHVVHTLPGRPAVRVQEMVRQRDGQVRLTNHLGGVTTHAPTTLLAVVTPNPAPRHDETVDVGPSVEVPATTGDAVPVGALMPGDRVVTYPDDIERTVRSTATIGLSPNIAVTFEDGSSATWAGAHVVHRVQPPFLPEPPAVPSVRAAHSAECYAYAVGCAVENIRDAADAAESAQWAKGADPITEGEGYLTDGLVCECASDIGRMMRRTYARGLAAVATHDGLPVDPLGAPLPAEVVQAIARVPYAGLTAVLPRESLVIDLVSWLEALTESLNAHTTSVEADRAELRVLRGQRDAVRAFLGQ